MHNIKNRLTKIENRLKLKETFYFKMFRDPKTNVILVDTNSKPMLKGKWLCKE